tara:strand:+ start:247 stop:600 length:354 start_codon:yes stop_codon:yes gene_type:complete
MATFPANIKPSYNSSENIKQDYIETQLGDGYVQRLVYGLPANKRLRNFSYKYELSKTDANTLDTFLNARFDANMEPFDFTPVDETSSIKVICTNRRKTVPYKNRVNYTLNFSQVNEP